MYYYVVLFVLLSQLLGCSAKLSEKKFIVQDQEVTAFKTSLQTEWKNAMPTYNVSTITVKSKDQQAMLAGVFIDNSASNDVLFFIQGNGMKIESHSLSAVKMLAQLNKDIVIFDRRGLGASSGKATIANLIEDAQTQLEYIRKNYQPNRIIVHGYSLGSFIAAHLAKENEIDALVLHASATNVKDWIDARMPWYSKPFISVEIAPAFIQADNQNIVKNYFTGPLLIIGGELDQQAPVSLSKKLFRASQSYNKKLVIVPKANHNNMLEPQTSIEEYQKFLRSL